MKKLTKQTVAITIISCLAAGTLLAAEAEGKRGEGKKFPGAGELKAYRAKQHKVRKEYREEQHKENQAFRESLKEKEPVNALPEIISHRKSQFSEIKSFAAGLYNDFVAYAKEIFAKHEVPTEKQEQMLAKMQEHRDEMESKHDEHHEALISALDALKGNEDLTWEDIKKVFEENAPERDGRGRRGGNGERKNN